MLVLESIRRDVKSVPHIFGSTGELVDLILEINRIPTEVIEMKTTMNNISYFIIQ